MTRAEELTLKLCDGTITLDQINELEWLIAGDSREASRHLVLLDVEALFRAQRQDLDVAAPVIQQLRQSEPAAGQAAAGSLSEPVGAAAASTTATAPAHRSSRRSRPAASAGGDAQHDAEITAAAAALQSTRAAGSGSASAHDSKLDHQKSRRRRKRQQVPLALYGVLAAAFILVLVLYITRNTQTNPNAPGPLDARVADFSGRVTIARAGTNYIAEVDSIVHPDNAVNTGTNSRANLLYDSSTRLELMTNSKLAFNPAPGRVTPSTPRRVTLHSGELRVAQVRTSEPRRVIVATPHAEIRPIGTIFMVDVTRRRTKVTVKGGRVQVEDRNSGQSVEVATDQFAVVEPSLPLRARAIDAVDRVTEGLVALYRFKAGAGTTIHDTAPNGPALNLTIGEEGAVRWANKSLSIVNPTTITSRSAASKLIDAIKRSGELSVELWLKPRDADPSGLAPIVALSENPEYVNFMVGQGAPDTDDPGGEARGAGGGDRYVARLRTTQTSASGEPGLRSSGGAAKPALTHLVYTRDESGTGQWFIDGRGRAKQPQAGELNNWSPQHMLSLGSLPTGEHHWFGDLRLVAIYSQALSRKQVQRNFDVGLVEPEVLADRDREQAAKDARKPDWQDVTLLRGVGSDRTLRFDVPGEEWKVRYKIKVTEATGEPFEVRVVPTADTNKAEQLFRIGSLEPNAPVADEALTPFGAGEYYLQVSGPDGAVWDMQVKQLR